MTGMIIKRFLAPENLSRMTDHMVFLTDRVKASKGELHIALRDNYFNIYSRGNSLAKVEFLPDGRYRVTVNEKFVPASLRNSQRFPAKQTGDYHVFTVVEAQLKGFFQKKHLDAMCSRIKRVNFSEELAFEQALIADNLDRDDSDFIIVDRQVTDAELRGQRMDVLALRQVKGELYRFLVIEAKMGNNPELRGDVAKQLDAYVAHIRGHVDDYKVCYEESWRQQKELGLIQRPAGPTIRIDTDSVEGMVVVAGYLRQAKEAIKTLTRKTGYPHPIIQLFPYLLDPKLFI
jgi:hypothetical protein